MAQRLMKSDALEYGIITAKCPSSASNDTAFLMSVSKGRNVVCRAASLAWLPLKVSSL